MFLASMFILHDVFEEYPDVNFRNIVHPKYKLPASVLVIHIQLLINIGV
jgi:hypothetical protein